ncbi:hypothetical protein [Desulfuromonas thiophila]|uniref:Uncharacterized protein n=1 Tax=Desulfuromonas thiophila TaxID=57664 RepID=A0A1G7C2D3_9BACT|nr:hypothetical protein [Desulfuromonas thiophila]SDE32836.1 hypothetical protein SAMN05661003_10825 [Desulfuromonas thiophila]
MAMLSIRLLVSFVIVALLTACGGDGGSDSSPALSADNVNLIFVVTPDLAYSDAGDIDPDTANLTPQGLQRSLMLASYLKEQVLGGDNVSKIYTISPMSHLQTANNYPDMTAIGFIQQFAMLNQTTSVVAHDGTTYTANNFPINVSYANEAAVPEQAAKPEAFVTGWPAYCPGCGGMDFANAGSINDMLVASIIDGKQAGYYVFSAPWETVSVMLTSIIDTYGYNLTLPDTYKGANYVYALSIPASGTPSLITYNSNLNPLASDPILPAEVPSAACTNSLQHGYRLTLYDGMPGVTVPANINTNSRIYIVRHAEAHPDPTYGFDDGNYVAAGQWRALHLATALRGKIAPSEVHSIDPAAVWYVNPYNPTLPVSYVRPALTVWPYAIANNLPFYLAAKVSLGNPYVPTQSDVAIATSQYFFNGGTFSNKTILVAWESGHIKPFLNELIKSYGIPADSSLLLDVAWPSADYDTIWTVTLDAQGSLTIDNELCEGIDSARLPETAPMF